MCVFRLIYLKTFNSLLLTNYGCVTVDVVRLKIPNTSSAEYLSMIGHLDSRVTLDRSIKPGDVNYFGALCMMASKLSYENEAHVAQIVKDVWKVLQFLIFNI